MANYPVLSEGQRVIVNVGRTLLACVVDVNDDPMVYYHGDEPHDKTPGNAARINVYAIPEESERLLQDIETQCFGIKYLAAKIAAKGSV